MSSNIVTRWFAATGVFLHTSRDPHCVRKYELRTTMCRARSKREAESRLIKEFKAYAQNGIAFLNEWEIFEIDGSPGRSPVEVAHEMITIDIPPRRFIRIHWFRGKPKSCRDMGWEHSWYNLDNQRSGCYNCRTVKKGRLWKTG